MIRVTSLVQRSLHFVRSSPSFFLGLILLCLTCTVPIQAQQDTGTVLGTITDALGRSVPNAKITLTSTERGLTMQQNTNKSGEYVFNALAVGTYKISVNAPTFATVNGDNLIVESGGSVRFDQKLVPASVEASVTVEAAGNGVDTESATVGMLLDPELIHNLPIDGNNVVALAALLPGVSNVNAPTTFVGDTNGPTYNVSGSRSTQNLFLLDGTMWNNLYTNSGLNFPPPDSLAQVSVLLNNFKAQYGRNAGSVFSTLTRSGTNTYHGVVYEYLQNTFLNAQDYFLKQPSKLIQNQFGATVGGPIVRDRLFFFGGYNGLRIAQQATVLSTLGFSPAERGLTSTGQPIPCSSTGYFVGHNCMNFNDVITTIQLQNPITAGSSNYPQSSAISAINAGWQQAGNSGTSPCVTLLLGALSQNSGKIPAGELPDECQNPVSYAIIQKYLPVPNRINPQTNLLSNTSSSAPLPSLLNSYIARVDYHLSSAHSIEARYYQTGVGDTVAKGSIQTYERDAELGATYAGEFGETWIIRPSLLNTAHFAYKRYNYDYSPTDPTTIGSFGSALPNYNSKATLPALSGTGLGSSSQALSHVVNENIEVTEALTWVKGNHNLQFGLDYLRLQYENLSESAPAFNFGEDYTLLPQADAILGLPYSETFANSLNRSGIQHDYYFYAQDDWRATRKLTLNLGLRYELPLRYYQPLDRDTTFVPGFHSIVFPNAVPDLAFVGDPQVPRGLIKNEYKDFAPRFGFAYDVFGNGRTAFRGGVGLFYDATTALTIGVGEPYHYAATYNFPAGGISQPLLGEPGIVPNYNGTNPQFSTPFSIFFPDRNFRGAYTGAGNIGLQQSIGKGGLLDVNYVLRLGRHQAIPIDLNYAIYDCTGVYYQLDPATYCPASNQADTTSFLNARVVYPGFNYGGQGVVDYNSIGTSNYNGLQVLYRQRASKDLTITSSFSYAKSMDEFSNSTTTSSSIPQVRNLKSEYAPSDYDVKLTAGLGWVFAPIKVNSGSHLLRAVLGGWTQSGIFSTQTGSPFSITIPGDYSLNDEPHQRAVLLPGFNTNPYLPNRHRAQKIQEWFNTSEWAFPADGTYSSQSRNDVRGPAFILTTASAGRTFRMPFREGMSLNFRADAINLFNTPNLANPGTSLPTEAGTSTFGIISATKGSNTVGTNARRVQLALRFTY